MRPMLTSGGRNRGLTLLEVAVATTIGAVMMVVVGNILSSSTDSVDTIVTGSVGDQDLKRSLNRVLEELQRSATTRIDIDDSDRDHDVLTVQTASTVSGSIAWGAVDPHGYWRQDWSARYLVVGGQLVRRVYTTAWTAYGNDEPIARDVDAVRDGRKGFRVVPNGTIVNVAIRVVRSYRSGEDTVREYDSSVMLKNG